MKPETMAIHLPDHRRNGAVAPPLHLTTTFEHGVANEPIHGYHYVRSGNPNLEDLEIRLAALDHGKQAVAFASGMAASAAMLLAAPPGVEIIFHRDSYFDVRTLANMNLPDRNIRPVYVDLTDVDALNSALSEKTALVWFETPSNPLLELIDIERVVEQAKKVGAKVLVDGTFATPVLQQPLLLGADYVLHSLTKYMGGHSDVQGGAIIIRDEDPIAADLKKIRTVSGAVLAPFNAWLISRGLQTLFCRVERQCKTAEALAAYLSQSAAIERVRYPFLGSDVSVALAKKQMSAGGGMLSIEVSGGRDAALKLAGNFKLFINATSLGGVESLVEHRASIETGKTTTPENLLRLSIGLEHVDDLIEDFDQAIAGL